VRDRDPRPRFNSNMKNNLRRCEARLAAQGKLSPVRLAPGDDLAAWTQQFLRLEASGWKGREGSALDCREDDRRFVAEVFPEAFRRGRLLITGLDLDGRPLARHVMLTGGEGAFTFKIAYDEAYAKCSPGIVAEVDNVRQFMETPGPRWIDSNTARENESYGRVWKDRCTFQRVAVGAGGAGRFAVAALPLMRLAKHWRRRRKDEAAAP
jgi:CelD/BcsL family acetyltransferase involved in cellulose biosynthesis